MHIPKIAEEKNKLNRKHIKITERMHLPLQFMLLLSSNIYEDTAL